MNIKQFAHLAGDGGIEIEKKLPPALKERDQVIGIKLEEWALTVGRLQGIPVKVPPGTMVAYANIAHLTVGSFVTFYGHGQGLQAACGGYDTAVTVGLLDEMVVAFNQATVRLIQFLVPLHGTKISGCKQAYHGR